MKAQKTAAFAELLDMVKTKTFVINHVVKGKKAAFGQALDDNTYCYLSPKFIKESNLEEGMLIKARVIKNAHTTSEGVRRTEWKAVSVLESGWLDYEIETVGEYQPEPVEKPKSLEDRVLEFFEEHPDDCFATRDISENLLGEKGINQDLADVLRRLHGFGDISQCRIKTRSSNKRGTVYWGLTSSSFGFDKLEEAEEDIE